MGKKCAAIEVLLSQLPFMLHDYHQVHGYTPHLHVCAQRCDILVSLCLGSPVAAEHTHSAHHSWLYHHTLRGGRRGEGRGRRGEE